MPAGADAGQKPGNLTHVIPKKSVVPQVSGETPGFQAGGLLTGRMPSKGTKRIKAEALISSPGGVPGGRGREARAFPSVPTEAGFEFSAWPQAWRRRQCLERNCRDSPSYASATWQL